MPRLADIALPVSVNKIFTYLIPAELEHSAVIGVRAIVPFGRTYSTGLIVGLPPSTSIRPLKPIRDIVDARPVVSDELLRLCTWIAEYYMSPLGEVLRTAMPHGFAATSKRTARLIRRLSPDELQALKRRAPGRAAIVSLLMTHEQMRAADLQRKTGLTSLNAILNDLVRDGLIATEEVLPRSSGRIVLKDYVDLASIHDNVLATELGRLPARLKRSRRLLEVLRIAHADGTKEIASADLLKKALASTAELRKLVAAGLITVSRREFHPPQEFGTDDSTLSHILNEDQQAALNAVTTALDGGTHRTLLLHGVTGSGKTQVYIEAIRHCLRSNRTAIVLVPEIGLTPQIVRRFRSHFGDTVAVVHSRMAAGERLAVWRRALAGVCSIVIGPRSAIFAPLANMGLIVVDEEHDASYKQFDAAPRYNARDVAIVRARLQHAVVLLGSATPSVESMYNAQQEKYRLLRMPHRIDRVPMPEIQIIDMTAERKREYAAQKSFLPEERRHELKRFVQPSISSLLRERIADRLSRHEGIILLQNRRGFAPFVECPECGYTEMCENCSVTMTYHLALKHLRCHYCGSVRPPHTLCPECHGTDLKLHGVGTQRVEQELGALFPDAKVVRMDLDTTSRKGSHDRILRSFADGQADILLGTQMVAKGLDFARVTLVGVISADTQMLLPDFRASERTFQLLTQVAGRAGRSTLRGEVIIQTHQPDHYVLKHVTRHDYQAFFEQELQSRIEPGYPPLFRLALVEARGKNEEKVRTSEERLAAILRTSSRGLTILGPSPAVISKVRSDYRWHLLIKTARKDESSSTKLRQVLREALDAFDARGMSDVRFLIDIDPVGIL